MIRRLLTGAALAVALLAAAASANAATRAIQAFDTPTFRTIWWPKSTPAQVGDTIQWRLTQPGNVNASTHDIWLQAPGAPRTPMRSGPRRRGSPPIRRSTPSPTSPPTSSPSG